MYLLNGIEQTSNSWREKFANFSSNFKRRLLSLFNGGKKNNLIGLEIEPHLLKVITINSNRTPYTVEHFAIAPLPTDSIVKDEIKEPVVIGNILQDTLKQANINAKNVALALPRSLAIIKTVTIDSRLSPEDIESRAWIEATRHFPDLIEDIYLDFAITGTSPQDPTQLEVMLVACRKDQIKPYLEILKQAGLTPRLIDINCFALERALPLAMQGKLETVALLNLNVNLSTFIVVNKNSLIHAHDQSYDGTRLLNQTKDYLSQKDNSPTDEKYTSILKENLISHLRHTIHLFYSSKPHINIQQIILAGDCATIPDLAAFIQREIGFETITANPFIDVNIPKDIDKNEFEKYVPALMQCCGLALSKLKNGL